MHPDLAEMLVTDREIERRSRLHQRTPQQSPEKERSRLATILQSTRSTLSNMLSSRVATKPALELR